MTMAIPEEVLKTLNDYAWGLDQDDLELTLSCYSDDAVVQITIDPERDHRGTFEGKDAIRGMYQPSRDAIEPGEQRRHFMTNMALENNDDDSVTVRSYFLVTQAKGPSMKLLTGGWIRFQMADRGGAMKIMRGEIHLDSGFSSLVK